MELAQVPTKQWVGKENTVAIIYTHVNITVKHCVQLP
jgi:hypothetical protein